MCCKDFKATWHFDEFGSGAEGNKRVRVFDTVDVENGFCPNTTIEERELLAANSFQEAIESPLSGAAISRTSQSGPYTIVQSRLYPASVRNLRIRCNSTEPFENAQIEYLFLRVFEMPLASSQDPLARGYSPAVMTHIPSRSSDGFQYYQFTAAEFTITPSASVEAIITPRGDFLKPRPTWGKTGFHIKSLSRNTTGTGTGVVILSDHPSTDIVFIPTFPRYSIPVETLPNYYLSENARFLTLVGNQSQNDSWVGSLRRAVFTLTVTRPPVDGETLTHNSDTRTWRTVVVDPDVEIECPDPTGEDALETACDNLAIHLDDHPLTSEPQGIHQRVNSTEWTFIQTGLVILSGLAMAVSSDWATLERSYMHGEAIWNPAPSAVFPARSINHPEWMAIPLNSAFDQIVAMPEMENPFYVQAFFSAPLYTDLPRETVPRDIVLQASPA